MKRNDFFEIVNSNLQRALDGRTYRTFKGIAAYTSQHKDGMRVTDSLELDILRSAGLIEYVQAGIYDTLVYGGVCRATLTSEGLNAARDLFPELYQLEQSGATV